MDELYRGKADGTFGRSRRKWLEEWEQNRAHFFRLEKFCAKNNSIQKLNIDDVITDDPKRIALYCSNFYSTLYQSNCSEESTLQFLDSLTETKTIDNDQSDFCDRPIKLGVVKLAIGHLKLNKSPGTDGIAVITSANKGADTRWSSNINRCWIDCMLYHRVKVDEGVQY